MNIFKLTFSMLFSCVFLLSAHSHEKKQQTYYEYIIKNEDIIIVKQNKKTVGYICRGCGKCFPTKRSIKSHITEYFEIGEDADEQWLHSQELGPE